MGIEDVILDDQAWLGSCVSISRAYQSLTSLGILLWVRSFWQPDII